MVIFQTKMLIKTSYLTWKKLQ